MRKFLIPLAAVAAIAAAAAPAAAQSRGDHGYNNSGRNGDYQGGGYQNGGGQLTTGYVDGLEWKINNAAREGRISRGEARALLNEFHQIQPLAWPVQTGQANSWQQRRLSQGVNRIEASLNNTRYAGRFDRNDRYDRADRRDDRDYRR